MALPQCFLKLHLTRCLFVAAVLVSKPTADASFVRNYDSSSAGRATSRRISSRRRIVPFLAQPTTSSTDTDAADLNYVSKKETASIQSPIMTSPVFGSLRRVRLTGDDDDDDASFVGVVGVPTFASYQDHETTDERPLSIVVDRSEEGYDVHSTTRIRGLEGALNHGPAFVVDNVLSQEACEQIIADCERLSFGQFDCGRNHHGAMQILVSQELSDAVAQKVAPHVDVDQIEELRQEMLSNNYKNAQGKKQPEREKEDVRLFFSGLNRRWRIYRYDPAGNDTFAPHIDSGFPPSGLSVDGTTLVWDDSPSDLEAEVVSRLTVLMYLNDDFVGGETNFYRPLSQQRGRDPANDETSLIASVRPMAGSVLLFPQGVGEEAVEYARQHWPLHEGSPVLSGRPKYIIRSDALFATQLEMLPLEDKLFQYDHLVRRVFVPKPSIVWNQKFLAHAKLLYNPHMGVENLGPFLYSFLRMTKLRRVVEIGAGFTSLWILQALKDNDDELRAVRLLQRRGQCKLLNIDWTIQPFVEDFDQEPSQLMCIDNCEHQKESATGASAVATSLGLDAYLEFQRGDAFDLDLGTETVDMLWCDFGVGSRMPEFISSAWGCIRPGGFLLCHSTLTNANTRSWLEAIRTRQPEDVTGISPDEYVELSLLEPMKRYQNSISVLQKRKSRCGDTFEEPIYSRHA